MLWCVLLCTLDREDCIQNADVQRIGSDEMTRNRLGIVPDLSFYCNARITGINVRVLRDDTNKKGILYIQVWRPSSPGSNIYSKIAEVPVTDNDTDKLTFLEAKIVLTGTQRIPVQLGDVIGYYQPPDSRFQVRSMETDGYVLYTFVMDGFYVKAVDLSKADYRAPQHQPLMLFTTGK